MNTHRATTHKSSPHPLGRSSRKLALTLFASTALFAACSSDASTKEPKTTTKNPGREAAVTIKTFQFSPNPATVSAGTIAIRNDDNTTHTFTSDDKGVFDVSITGPDKTATVDVAAGTYKFHCEIHPSMTGELVVT